MKTNKIILTKDITVYIDNPLEGQSGRLIVKQDNIGGHAVFLPAGHFGDVLVEATPGKSTLLEWIADDEGVYWQSHVITPVEVVENPTAITDLTYEYVDTVTAKIKWTAPMGKPNSPFDKVTRYRIYISEAEISELGLDGNKLVKNLIKPSFPDNEEKFIVSGLVPGHKYYVAIVSEKFTDGKLRKSSISNVISFLTKQSNVPTQNNVSKLIPIDKRDVYEWKAQYQYNDDHEFMTFDGLTDYSQIVINDSGVPVGIGDKPLSIFNYGQMDLTWYNENGVKFRIELDGLYNIEYFYLYAMETTPINFTISCSSDGVNFVEVAHVIQPNIRNSWNKIEIDVNIGINTKYLELDFLLPEQTISGFLVFGTRREMYNIKGKKYKRLHTVKPFNDFVGTNGFLLETDAEKINKVATPMRLYNESEWLITTDLADQPGSGENLQPNEITYRFSTSHMWDFDLKLEQFITAGLKPFLCLNHAPLYLRYQGNAPGQQRKAIDPLLDIRDLANTTNPNNYKHFARFAYNLAARYGSNANADQTYIQLVPNEPLKKGLDLVSYYEFLNELEGYWLGQDGYHNPNEMAACLSALADGNNGTIGNGYGIKAADPNAKMVMNALSKPTVGYARQMCSAWDLMRGPGDYPVDVLNIHYYNGWEEITGTQIYSKDERFGVHPETSNFRKLIGNWVEFRDIHMPRCELWVTETGYDEHRDGVQSPPDLDQAERSLHKAYWLMRTFLFIQALGADVIHQFWYSNMRNGVRLQDLNPNINIRDIFITCGYTEGSTDSNDLNRMKLVSYYYIAALRKEMEGYTYSHTVLDAGEHLTSQQIFRTVSPKIFANAYVHPTEGSLIVAWLGVGDFSTANVAINVALSENVLTTINFENVEQTMQEYGNVLNVTSDTDVSGKYITVQLSEIPLIIKTSNIGVQKLLNPENLKVEPLNTSSVKLAWWDKNIGTNPTKIFQSNNPDNGYELINDTYIDNGEFIVTGLSENTNYYFRIQFENGNKQSEISETTGILTPITIDVPSNFKAINTSATSITLGWDYSSANQNYIDEFEIYRSESIGGTYALLNRADATERTYNDQGLIVDTAYFYKLRAKKQNSFSLFTLTLSTATDTPQNTPPKVASLKSNYLGNKITIVFDKEIMDPVGNENAFTITQNSAINNVISIIQVDPFKIALNMQNSFVAYDQIILGYDSNIGNIQSIFNIDMEALSNSAVTNHVNDPSLVSRIMKFNLQETSPNGTNWNDILLPNGNNSFHGPIKDSEGELTSYRYLFPHGSYISPGADQDYSYFVQTPVLTSDPINDKFPHFTRNNGVGIVAYGTFPDSVFKIAFALLNLDTSKEYLIESYVTRNGDEQSRSTAYFRKLGSSETFKSKIVGKNIFTPLYDTQNAINFVIPLYSENGFEPSESQQTPITYLNTPKIGLEITSNTSSACLVLTAIIITELNPA